MTRISRHDLYYLLGYGFLDYRTQDEKLILTKHRHHRSAMDELSFWLNNKPAEVDQKLSILIDHEEITSFLQQHGVSTPKRYMPSVSDEFAWSFMAGYFDAYGEFSFKANNPRVSIHSPVRDVIDFIAKHWQVRNHTADRVIANGYKALDICGTMYKNVNLREIGKFSAFMDILNFRPDKALVGKAHHFEYMKLHPNALPPQKTYVTDSGFDLHILELTKLYQVPGGASVYQGKTELAIKPILGYAFDINGRSSLPKSGWLFLQGTGICDRSYTGGVQATFMKLNDEPLPKFPWKALQLIPREAPLHADFVERRDLGESFRGAGGFGSTNFK